MGGREYVVEYEGDLIKNLAHRFEATLDRAQVSRESAATADERHKAQRLMEEIALTKARLGHFIRDLGRNPHRILEPPPIRLKIDGEEVLEFRPMAVYKGKPSRPITARAWVNEARRSVKVYLIRLDIPGEGGVS